VQPLLQYKNNNYCIFCCVFVVLGSSTQCACVLMSFVACPVLQYFSTLSHKRHDFRKKKTVFFVVLRIVYFCVVICIVYFCVVLCIVNLCCSMYCLFLCCSMYCLFLCCSMYC